MYEEHECACRIRHAFVLPTNSIQRPQHIERKMKTIKRNVASKTEKSNTAATKLFIVIIFLINQLGFLIGDHCLPKGYILNGFFFSMQYILARKVSRANNFRGLEDAEIVLVFSSRKKKKTG